MAKTLSSQSIETTQTVEAWHVTQSIDAFTGTEAYNLSLSGSLHITGSIYGQPGIINQLTASYAEFAVSASHEITHELSSSHAISADTASLANTASIANAVAATNIIQPFTNITSSGDISSSGTVIAKSGSFSHLVGNSPITIASPTTFLQPVTASFTVSASNGLFISSSLQATASQILVYDTSSGKISFSDFPVQTAVSGGTVTIGDIDSELELEGDGIKLDGSSGGTSTGGKLDVKSDGDIDLHSGQSTSVINFKDNSGAVKANFAASSETFTIGTNTIRLSGSGDISASGDLQTRHSTASAQLITNTGTDPSLTLREGPVSPVIATILMLVNGIDYDDTGSAAVQTDFSGSVSASNAYALKVTSPDNTTYGIKASGEISSSKQLITSKGPNVEDLLTVLSPPSANFDDTGSAAVNVDLSGSVSASNAYALKLTSPDNNTFGIKADGSILSGDVSGSGVSTASFGTYRGDGAQLTGIETDPFPYTGSAIISGSTELIGPVNITGSTIIFSSGTPGLTIQSNSDVAEETKIYDAKIALEDSGLEQVVIKSNTSTNTMTGNISLRAATLAYGFLQATNWHSNNRISWLSSGIRLGEKLSDPDSSPNQTSPFVLSATGSVGFEGNTQITGSLSVSGSGIEFITSAGVPVFSIAEIGSFALGEGATSLVDTNVVIGKNAKDNNASSANSVVIGTNAQLYNAASQHSAIAIGESANVRLQGVAIGRYSTHYGAYATTVGYSAFSGPKGVAIGYNSGVAGGATSDVINIGYEAGSTGANSIVLNASGLAADPTKANAFGIYLTDTNPVFEIEATGSTTLSGSNLVLTNDISGSAASTASFGTYRGDGSSLTGIETDPFPYTGDATITGSLTVSGSFNAHQGSTTNIVIGEDAGNNLGSSSQKNVIIGSLSGQDLSQHQNVAVGHQSLTNLVAGVGNVAVGYLSLYSSDNNRNYNTAIGDNSGANGKGSGTTYLGASAGKGISNAASDYGVYVGFQAGLNIYDADFNTVVGAGAALNLNSGDYNIVIGREAGNGLVDGDRNIAIGYSASFPGDVSDQLIIGSGSLATISASLATGDLIFASTASSPIFSGKFEGDTSGSSVSTGNVITTTLTASGEISASDIYATNLYGADAVYHKDDANTGIVFSSDTIKLRTNNIESIHLSTTSNLFGNDQDPTIISGSSLTVDTSNTTITGSLNVTGSIEMALPSGSGASYQSFGVPGYFKTRFGQNDSDFEIYRDNFITLQFNNAGSDQIEGSILTDPSAGEIHVTVNNEGTYTYLDKQVSDGIFDIDGSFGNDEISVIYMRSPQDDSWPFYKITVISANATSGASITFLLEKFI